MCSHGGVAHGASTPGIEDFSSGNTNTTRVNLAPNTMNDHKALLSDTCKHWAEATWVVIVRLRSLTKPRALRTDLADTLPSGEFAMRVTYQVHVQCTSIRSFKPLEQAPHREPTLKACFLLKWQCRSKCHGEGS